MSGLRIRRNLRPVLIFSLILGGISAAVVRGIPGGGGAPVTVQFEFAQWGVSESGTTATVTVTLSNVPTGNVTAVVSTDTGGSAIDQVNYISSSKTLTWNSSDKNLTRSFVISVLNDNVTSPPLTVNLGLSALTGGATLGSNPTAVLYIIDSQSPFCSTEP